MARRKSGEASDASSTSLLPNGEQETAASPTPPNQLTVCDSLPSNGEKTLAAERTERRAETLKTTEEMASRVRMAMKDIFLGSQEAADSMRSSLRREIREAMGTIREAEILDIMGCLSSIRKQLEGPTAKALMPSFRRRVVEATADLTTLYRQCGLSAQDAKTTAEEMARELVPNCR